MRKIRNGIAIETTSEKERAEILKCKKFAEVGLEARLSRRIRPKLIIYDVPNRITDEGILEELYAKNLEGRIAEQKFREGIRIVSKRNK